MKKRTENEQSSLNVGIKVLPIHQREFLQLAMQIISEGREEAGNINYSLKKDMEEDFLYNLQTLWKNRKLMEAYISSQSFGTLLGALNILSISFEFNIHSRTHHESESVIKSIRKAR